MHAFVHREAGSVGEVRRHLALERGGPHDALSVFGYRKLTRSVEDWRAKKAEWNRQVEQDEPAAG